MVQERRWRELEGNLYGRSATSKGKANTTEDKANDVRCWFNPIQREMLQGQRFAQSSSGYHGLSLPHCADTYPSPDFLGRGPLGISPH